MSYGIYIGKNLTRDGISYLGGYGDEPSSHWLELIPAADRDSAENIPVGVDHTADMPGVRSTVPQSAHTARHLRVSYSYYKGVPAPITNGGLNEYGVAVRDIWSTSRQELIDMTPTTQSGPNYSDLARFVLERAETARQGVELIGALIGEYGESSYGGNSHLIADDNEAWVVIQFAGGQGLWAAERLGDNSIRASRPGYILSVPIDQLEHPDYLYSSNFVSFAVSKGWFNSDRDMEFNANLIYGDGKQKWDGVEWIESQMLDLASRPERIGIEDVMWAVRTPKLTGDTAGYGQVVPLREQKYSMLRMMWHAHIGAMAAPFTPVYMGMQEVPFEYRKHRYLSVGESSRFMDMRHYKQGETESLSTVSQGVESTRSATAIYKRLLYLVLQNPEEFADELQAIWMALESELLTKQSTIAKTSIILLEQKEANLAEQYLDYYCGSELDKALDSAEILAKSFELRTRLKFGIKNQSAPLSMEQIW